MAERVDKMPEGPKETTNKYPWGEWLDGSAWELIQGKDFECPASSMVSTVRSAAGTRRVTVKVMIRGDRVYVQAQRDGR